MESKKYETQGNTIGMWNQKNETQGNTIGMWNQKNMKLKEILLECGIK